MRAEVLAHIAYHRPFAVIRSADAARAIAAGEACLRGGLRLREVTRTVSSFGGPSYLKALREPLPFLRLMPSGGVDETHVRAYLEAGAAALGLGGRLIDRASVERGDWAAIEEKARRVTEAVAGWRKDRAAGP